MKMKKQAIKNLRFQKTFVLPSQKKFEFRGGGGNSLKAKHLKNYMKLNRNFQRGGEGRC